MAVRLTIAGLEQDLARSLAELRADTNRVVASRARVERALTSGVPYYSINTGFGVLKDRIVPPDKLVDLQRNLLWSHAVGVGDPVPREITRLMLDLKVHSLGLGFSGVSLGTFDRLLSFAERDLVPFVPGQGSVGASGDLAPLAHLSLPLLGEGQFWPREGTAPVPAGDVLAAHGFSPIELQPKDGLALINGTQMMAAYGAYVLHAAISLLTTADIISAMTLEALQGSDKPFDPRTAEVRPHRGHAETASNVRALLAESEILQSHRFCGKIQDPYSLRCIPQVHGASRDALRHAREVVEVELNSVTDNPLVFEDGSIVSGGNFHGQPLALALDYAAMAIAELGNISERRTYLLLAGEDGLPRLLMRETGVNSGFMIPQYTAAALVSENKVLCHPASVDSIPTSLGQEDHVSMGSISARKLLTVLRNVEYVLGIELLCAAQALDYRRPVVPGKGVAAAHECVRTVLPHTEEDRLLQPSMLVCRELVADGRLRRAAEERTGTLV